MKKRTLIFAIMTVAFVMFCVSARAEEPKITAEMWAFYPEDNAVHFAGKVKTNFNYGYIEIIDQRAGCVIEKIPGASSTTGDCNVSAIAFTNHVPVNAFSFNVAIEDFASSATINLAAFDTEGNWITSTPIFSRKIDRWVPEVFSTQIIPEGCGMASIAVTFEFHSVYGNTPLSDGKPFQIVVGGYTFSSTIYVSGDKRLGQVLVPREIFQENFLGEAVTVFQVESETVRASRLLYPAENYDLPEYRRNPAEAWIVQ